MIPDLVVIVVDWVMRLWHFAMRVCKDRGPLEGMATISQETLQGEGAPWHVSSSQCLFGDARTNPGHPSSKTLEARFQGFLAIAKASTHPLQKKEEGSPSSALLLPCLGEGSPTKIDYKKRVPLFEPLYWRT